MNRSDCKIIIGLVQALSAYCRADEHKVLLLLKKYLFTNLEYILLDSLMNLDPKQAHEMNIESYWKNTPPPKDRMIMRWHVLWKCALPVFWANQKHLQESNCPWVNGEKNGTWPEEAFSPFWAECPNPPQDQCGD